MFIVRQKGCDRSSVDIIDRTSKHVNESYRRLPRKWVLDEIPRRRVRWRRSESFLPYFWYGRLSQVLQYEWKKIAHYNNSHCIASHWLFYCLPELYWKWTCRRCMKCRNTRFFLWRTAFAKSVDSLENFPVAVRHASFIIFHYIEKLHLGDLWHFLMDYLIY